MRAGLGPGKPPTDQGIEVRQSIRPLLHPRHTQIINHTKQDRRTSPPRPRDTPNKIKINATVVLGRVPRFNQVAFGRHGSCMIDMT